MPLLTGLEFASTALFVRYRATSAPQDLEIDIQTGGLAGEPTASLSLARVLDSINAGGAGGAEFAPWTGSAERMSGPSHADDAIGPSYQWILRVAGVAPLFLRNVVEQLRDVGMLQPVHSMRIHGSAPLDESELSVREDRVRRWLDDPLAYVGEWPQADFPIALRRARGATLRVALGTRITLDLRDQLEELVIRWLVSISRYVSDPGLREESGLEVLIHPSQILPSFGVGRAEMRAKCEEFPYTRGPSRAILQNMLIRFHRTVAPIVEVEIGL